MSPRAKTARSSATPSIETREAALERLLLVACNLLPDDLAELGEDQGQLAELLTGEATFWLDFVPRGMKPSPTVPATRLGYVHVIKRRKNYKLVGATLMPVKKEKK